MGGHHSFHSSIINYDFFMKSFFIKGTMREINEYLKILATEKERLDIFERYQIWKYYGTHR